MARAPFGSRAKVGDFFVLPHWGKSSFLSGVWLRWGIVFSPTTHTMAEINGPHMSTAFHTASERRRDLCEDS